MYRFLLLWMALWASLSFLFLPISFAFLPDAGIWLSTLIFPINHFICSTLFGVDIQQSYLVSDSLAFYSTGIVLLIVSAFICLLIIFKFSNYLSQISHGLYTILIVVLSYYLLRYGFDKIIGQQFYSPASNTLFTPLGNLSKDMLFWTSMGTSSFYNAFMAFLEITAGVLLLFNRTRFPALLLSFGVLLNVSAINTGFDITVKYLSGLLLLTSIICLFFHVSKIGLLFDIKTVLQSEPAVSKPVLLFLLIPFATELAVSYWNVNPNRNYSGASYAVKSVEGTSNLIDVENIVRLHIHPNSYLVTETKEQRFTSYQMGKNQKSVVINGNFVRISFSRQQLTWTEGENKIEWSIQPIELENLEVKKDQTHWYFEQILQ